MTDQLVEKPAAPASPDGGGWTGALRRRFERSLPLEKLMADRQPSYVESWIYVFGVLTLTALCVVIGSGVVLAVKGPSWWHVSGFGHYLNSVHLWAVELLMAFMSIHLVGKFFMAAWRGKRAMTWITGAVAFGACAFTALTGYLIQQNFESQWIATQAKDGLNAIGVGAYFNVMNFGQMVLWHVALLPLGVGVVVLAHVVLVRRHGVVPPLDKAAAGEPSREAS
jgi:ubiquinol-cytochrome c reductase cytochrome b subunit